MNPTPHLFLKKVGGIRAGSKCPDVPPSGSRDPDFAFGECRDKVSAPLVRV